MAKRGRKPSGDLTGKTFTLDGEDFSIRPIAGSLVKDMYGNIVLWDGDGSYFNPWNGEEEKLPKGKRAATFVVIFEVDGEKKELRFNCERKLLAAERRMNAKG